MDDKENFFKEVEAFLMVEREQTDRFLRDFAAGWQGTYRDETGVLDNIPQAYIDEWNATVGGTYSNREGNQQKQDHGFTVGNIAAWTDDNGNIVLAQANDRIVISANERAKFLAAFMALPAGSGNAPATGTSGYGGQASAQNTWEYKIAHEDNPILKERMQRNLEELERWAKASSRAYPRHS